MAVDEAARHELYSTLDELLGRGPTSTLMSLLPPVGWADVATKDDLRTLDANIRTEIAGVRVEIAEVRTEVAGVRTEMHDSMRRLALTMVAAMVSISGVTFAATALL